MNVKVRASTTHVVASAKDFTSNAPKVKEAIALGSDVHIMNFDWLEKSLDAKAPIDTSAHLLSGSAAAAPAPKAKKRGWTQDDDDDDAGPSVDGARISQSAEPPNKKFKDGQVAQGSHIVVPIDEDCNVSMLKRVHIDDDGVIWDANLNQTNSGQNNNKFYRIQLIDTGGGFVTWTRWGRVGERGMSATLGDGDFMSGRISTEPLRS